MGGVPDRAEGVNAEYIDRDAFIEQKRKQYCGDCERRKGMKNGKYKTLYEIGEAPCRACGIDDMLNDVEDFPAADVRPVVRGHKVTHNRPIAGYWASGKLEGGWDGMEGRVWVKPIENNPVDYCSECGKRLDDTFQNFCPNCGADMRRCPEDEAAEEMASVRLWLRREES